MPRAPLPPPEDPRLSALAAFALAACGSPVADPTGSSFSRLSSYSPTDDHKANGLGIDWVALLKELGSADSTGGTR